MKKLNQIPTITIPQNNRQNTTNNKTIAGASQCLSH
jgi:hypothetical protein